MSVNLKRSILLAPPMPYFVIPCSLCLYLFSFLCLVVNASEKSPDHATEKRTFQSSVSAGNGKKTKNDKWVSLFDGKSLDGWTKPEYGGDGDIQVKNGCIYLGAGAAMTGIRFLKKLPSTTNYEISYEAKRTDGNDFFAALTFPVGDSHCTFINGGWGGSMIGLSSIDGMDASENETSDCFTFKDDTWYAFRVRVADERITVWVAEQTEELYGKEKQMIDCERNGRGFDTRFEAGLYKPLGFCTWCTEGILRNIKIRRLSTSQSTSKH